MLFTPNACSVEAGYILDRAVPTADENIRVHDGGGYVTMTAVHTGPFSAIGKAYEALEELMHIHGYVSAGAPVEYYLSSPDAPPQQQRAEIVWPVVPNEA